MVRRLLVNPELVEPRKTEITVMFSDIRGFTTISEKLDAQELALFLNQYLSDMTEVVFKHRGTLDKYIGDAVMAFWGAPFEDEKHAAEACQTALDMMARIHEMQKEWEAEAKPRLDIGIGLNTGVASVGNMGSSLRYGYTALGDSVNLSSRLEGLNKDYGTHILVNETTFVAARDSGFIFRELDMIRVKGKHEPVTIYELVGSAVSLSADTQVRLDRFRDARALYHRKPLAPSPGGVPVDSRSMARRRPGSGVLEALPGIPVRRTERQLGRRVHDDSQVAARSSNRTLSQRYLDFPSMVQFGGAFLVTNSALCASIR